jgi:dimethylglycine dehydrogenase
MRSRSITIAGIDAIAIRVSFTGDLGWEIYVKTENQLKLYEALLDTGADLGVRPVGGRSLLSLRVEKGYGSWGREYSPEYWPQEVGLERLIKLDKPDFLGKEAYLKIMDLEPREKLVVLEVTADQDADPVGGEPVFLKDGTPVGRVTSGAYGYTCDKSLAICMIKTDYALSGNEFHVAVIGQNHEAVMLTEPPFDPKGVRLRS